MQNLRNKAYHWLRGSESFFKTDMIYLAKGGLWTTLRFTVGALASVVTMIAFGNLLPRETYGTYNYLLSLGATLSFLTLSGISIGVIRAVARGQEAVVPYAVRLQLRYNSLASLTIALAALYYGAKGNGLFAVSLLILAVSIPVSAAYFTFESVLIGQKKFETLTKLTSLSTILSAVATVVTIILTDNVVTIIAVSALMLLIPNIIIYHKVAKTLSQEKPNAETIKELRGTTFHLTGAGLISSLAQYLDKIILFQVAGPAALAVYGFAIAGPEKLKGLIKNWTGIALPKLAEKSLREIRRIFYKRLASLLLLGLLLSGIYIFLAPFLFHLFLPKYLDSIFYSQIYALGLIAMPASIYVGNIFLGQNMLRAVYIYSTGIQVLRISLFVVLGWYWQIWGLIFASIFYYFGATLYSIVIWEIEARRLIKK